MIILPNMKSSIYNKRGLASKILITGSFTAYNGTAQNYITRLYSDGILDTNFITGPTIYNTTPYALAIQSDGKIVVVGFFSGYCVRFNSDGSTDTNFAAIDTGGSQIFAVVIQSSGKIIIGGQFSSINGTSQARISRLNSDGTVDTSFSIGTGFSGTVRAMVIQPDGKIIVGGQFTAYNGTTRNRIARLNSDGTLDTSFAPTGSGLGGTVFAIALQSDGKIIVGGQFTAYNGTTQNRIARLNSDGTLDTSFNIGTGISGGGIGGSVLLLAIQSDGKVVVGGSFTAYNGTTRNRIARLNSDGSFDTSFTIGTGFNNSVNAIAIQSDNKIVVGGNFGSYNGTAQPFITRLNSNGTLDTSFTIGTGFNSSVNAMLIS